MTDRAESARPGVGMQRSELRWCLVFALLLAAATAAPYLVGAANADADWEFTGFVVAVEDGNSYLAKMLAGWEGQWLFRSPYSTAPQRGVLAFLPYLLLGKLSDGSHSQRVLLFHLLRIAAIPLLVLSVYRFTGRFIADPRWRKWVTLLSTAGGGLGWVVLALGAPDWLGSLPLDFYSPETFGFLGVLGFPHLILARAGMLWGLDLYLTRSRGWAAGLALLAVGVLHAPILVPTMAALAAHQLALLVTGRSTAEWRNRAGRVVLALAPLAIYLAAALATDPYLQAWAEQNRIRSPHPLHYLLAYGAILPAALFGARRIVRAIQPRKLLPLAWALALPFLAYAPVDLQRRLTDGGWVALLILAGLGLVEGTDRSSGRDRRGRNLRIGYTVLLLPSSLLLVAGSLVNLNQPAEPIFRRTAETSAFSWLAENAQPASTVLAAFSTGNALPAWAPVTVIAGHGPESAGLAELRPTVDRFFSASGADLQRAQLIDDQGVDYVFWGPAEQAIDGWAPDDWACLELAYERRGVQIYTVCDG